MEICYFDLHICYFDLYYYFDLSIFYFVLKNSYFHLLSFRSGVALVGLRHSSFLSTPKLDELKTFFWKFIILYSCSSHPKTAPQKPMSRVTTVCCYIFIYIFSSSSPLFIVFCLFFLFRFDCISIILFWLYYNYYQSLCVVCLCAAMVNILIYIYRCGFSVLGCVCVLCNICVFAWFLFGYPFLFSFFFAVPSVSVSVFWCYARLICVTVICGVL